MAVYITVLILGWLTGICANVNRDERRKKAYVIFIFAIMIVLSALRAQTVGRDLEGHYYKMFYVIKSMGWDQLGNTSYEIGYACFYKLISLFTNDAQWMIAIHSFFVIGVSGWFIYRNSDDVVLSSFMFIATNTWFMYMTMMRQSMAVCFELIALEFLKEKKWKAKNIIGFLLFSIIAFLFHSSAGVLFVLPVFFKLKFRKKEILYSVAGIIAVSFMYQRIFILVSSIIGGHRNYAEFYSSSGAAINLVSLYGVLINVLIVFIACIPIVNYKNNAVVGEKLCGEGLTYSNAFLMYMGTILILTKVMGLNINIMSRMSYYFLPFSWLLLPRGIKLFRIESNRKIIRVFMYLMMSIAFIWMGYRVADILYGTVPYSFFWNA